VLLLTAGALWWVFREVPFSSVLSALSHADPAFFGLGVVVSLWFNVVASALAFRSAVRATGSTLTRAGALRATLGNLALHNVLPSGSGTLGLAAIVHRRDGVPGPPAAFAAVFLLWLKLCAVLALGSAASLYAHVAPELRAALWIASLGCVTLGLVLYELGPRLARWAPFKRVSLRLGAAATMPALRAGPMLWTLLHVSSVVVGETVLFGLVLHAMGQNVAWMEVLARVPLVLVAAKLPLTVLGLGTREAAALLLLAGLSPEADIVAGTLLFLALTQLLPAALGALFTRWSVGSVWAQR
jgi:uncharacterized membrane protein YbhN (UPF0104 family)